MRSAGRGEKEELDACEATRVQNVSHWIYSSIPQRSKDADTFLLDAAIQPPTAPLSTLQIPTTATRERSPSFFEPATHDSAVIHLPRTGETFPSYSWSPMEAELPVSTPPMNRDDALKRMSGWPIVKISVRPPAKNNSFGTSMPLNRHRRRSSRSRVLEISTFLP